MPSLHRMLHNSPTNPDREATVTAAARRFYKHTADFVFFTYRDRRPSSRAHVHNTHVLQITDWNFSCLLTRQTYSCYTRFNYVCSSLFIDCVYCFILPCNVHFLLHLYFMFYVMYRTFSYAMISHSLHYLILRILRLGPKPSKPLDSNLILQTGGCSGSYAWSINF